MTYFFDQMIYILELIVTSIWSFFVWDRELDYYEDSRDDGCWVCFW